MISAISLTYHPIHNTKSQSKSNSNLQPLKKYKTNVSFGTAPLPAELTLGLGLLSLSGGIILCYAAHLLAKIFK